MQFTAIRARVSVITCYAHSEMVELQYWLLLMLPLVGLVCIKSDKSDPFVSTLADPLVHLKKMAHPETKKKSVESLLSKYQRGSTLNDDWLSILIGPGLRPLLIGPWFRTRWKRTRDRRPVMDHLDTDYWTVDGHVTIISNRTIRTRPDPYTQVGTLVFVVRKVGMIWYL